MWLLLLLNPISNFLSIEILQNQSSNEIVSSLVEYLSIFGLKNVFISDLGSNVMPIATKCSGQHQNPSK